jgi:uncharacterized membrane protein YeaQ/YmgE (transglycosylase-associated protein family)
MPLWLFFMLLAEGLVAGAVAQSLLPELAVGESLLFGLLGSYLAGLMGWMFVNAGFGFVFGVLGAAVLLYTRRRFAE